MFPLGGFVVVALVLAIQQSLALKILLVASFAASVATTCVVVRLNAKYHRAVSTALGVPIGLRSNRPPPSKKSDYLDWCKRIGVEPYPFDRS